jgi:hypothetical protein
MATKDVRLTLGGKERTLKYTLWSVGEIGDRLGLKLRLNHLAEDLMEAPLSLRALTTILWAGLIHEDQSLTEQQVGEWVDQDNVREVLDAFFSLFGGRLPENTRRAVAEKLGVESETVLTPT